MLVVQKTNTNCWNPGLRSYSGDYLHALTEYCANEASRNSTTRCHPEFFGAQRRKVSKDEQRQAFGTKNLLHKRSSQQLLAVLEIDPIKSLR